MSTRKKRAGRPPAAVDERGEPEETSRWDQISFNIRPATKVLLNSVRALTPSIPLWKLFEDILLKHVEHLPAADRRLIKALAARSQK
jgi:hypothetical protein